MVSVFEATSSLSDAINLVRSLKRILPKICPDCRQKIGNELLENVCGGANTTNTDQSHSTGVALNYDRSK